MIYPPRPILCLVCAAMPPTKPARSIWVRPYAATGVLKTRPMLKGTEEEITASFMTAYRILRYRIEQFLALPLDELQHDRDRLKVELDHIGNLLP